MLIQQAERRFIQQGVVLKHKEARIAKSRLELQAQDNKYTPEKNYTFIEIQICGLKNIKLLSESTLSRVSFLFTKIYFLILEKERYPHLLSHIVKNR